MFKTFYHCDSISDIRLGCSLTTIGSSSFYGCSNIRYLIIPDNVRNINSNAFDGCTSLDSLVLGNSTATIQVYAFRYCPITKIYSYANIPPIVKNKNSFSDSSYEKATLYVPEESIEDYKEADVWKLFYIKSFDTTGITSVETESDNEIIGIYDIQGRKQSDIMPGLNIVKKKNGKSIKLYR